MIALKSHPWKVIKSVIIIIIIIIIIKETVIKRRISIDKRGCCIDA